MNLSCFCILDTPQIASQFLVCCLPVLADTSDGIAYETRMLEQQYLRTEGPLPVHRTGICIAPLKGKIIKMF